VGPGPPRPGPDRSGPYYLIRAFLLTDRIGNRARLGEEAFAIAVALAEAGQITLAWQLIGYGQTHFRHSPVRNRSRNWLQARLAHLETTIDTTQRDSAMTAGARLDRRGFMRLLAQAENSAERPLRPAPGVTPA
jgi:hypothetical protein